MTISAPPSRPTTRLTALLVALLVVLTVASSLVWWQVVHPSKATSAGKPTPSPTAPTAMPSASPSPQPSASASTVELPRSAKPLDDEQIVWRHGVDDKWTASTISSSGAEGKVVLGSGKQDIALNISPDRRTVIFVRREKPGIRSSVHVIAADGSSERFLFRDGTDSCPLLRQAFWGTNGTLGLVCKADQAGTSYTLETATYAGKVIHKLDSGLIGAPSFSPDGRYLLYPKASSGFWKRGGSLYVVRTDGSGEPTRLIGGRNAAVSWASVGDLVAFSRFDDDDTSQIVTARVDGTTISDVDVLTSTGVLATDPSWSPDGGSLVFREGPDEDHYRLMVMTSEGDDERELSSTGTVGSPSWS